MAKLTSAEATKARADLKAKGCPDDCIDKIVNAPGINPGLLGQILAWLAAHPNAVGDIWSFVSLLIAAFTPATP